MITLQVNQSGGNVCMVVKGIWNIYSLLWGGMGKDWDGDELVCPTGNAHQKRVLDRVIGGVG